MRLNGTGCAHMNLHISLSLCITMQVLYRCEVQTDLKHVTKKIVVAKSSASVCEIILISLRQNLMVLSRLMGIFLVDDKCFK